MLARVAISGMLLLFFFFLLFNPCNGQQISEKPETRKIPFFSKWLELSSQDTTSCALWAEYS